MQDCLDQCEADDGVAIFYTFNDCYCFVAANFDEVLVSSSYELYTIGSNPEALNVVTGCP